MQTPIAELWPGAALAFRGYNTANLGRTDELLACPAYAPRVRARLDEAGAVCADILGRPVDLERRVREGREACLADYAEAVALVFATEAAQLDLLREAHGIDIATAELAFGYSLGELAALSAAGVLDGAEALRVPLAMAGDSARLAEGVTMGVLFSRQLPIDEAVAARLCDEITQAGAGAIGISAVLSPNTLLLLGQGETIQRFRTQMNDAFPSRVHLKLNHEHWPPLHTPLIWQKNIVDRAAVMIGAMRITDAPPAPPVVSLVTGKPIGDRVAIRQTLRNWVDHPQRLWDAVCAVLHSPTQTVLHIGPAPNVIPATFARLSENVRQFRARNDLSGMSLRALGPIIDRPWLNARLPTSAALLRAPQLEHVVLEDWLIENAPQ
ncbi:MAG: ACP S-malonyltransferase [Planctomycetota bacterium]